MLAMRRARSLAMMLMAALLLVGTVATVQIATAPRAQAQCVTSPLVGNWHNIDPATRSMTRVNVGFNCGDTVTCDENGNCSGGESYYTLHPYGACHPSDCDWGVQRATSMGDGWQRAIFNFGFKTSYVWVKTYPSGGTTYLRAWVYNDFTPADGRTDYTTDEWMVK